MACRVSAANAHDSRFWLPLLMSISMLKAKSTSRAGRRRGNRDRLSQRLLGDRAYGSNAAEELLAYLGVESNLARPGTPHGSGLGKERYVVEQTLAAIHQSRRLKIRYEKRADIRQALLSLACIKVCSCRLLQ